MLIVKAFTPIANDAGPKRLSILEDKLQDIIEQGVSHQA